MIKNKLFKGKRVDNGEWVKGYYNYNPFAKRAEIIAYDEVRSYVYKVIPETVSECTGLLDKNDVEIFEHDVIKVGVSGRLMDVRWNPETLSWELTDVGTPYSEVNHLLNTISLGEIQIEYHYGDMVSEIVGNVYDNPEYAPKEPTPQKNNIKF